MKFYMRSLSLFMDVVNTMNPGRLLGLKVGTKYIGVAVSDTNYELASPYWYELNLLHLIVINRLQMQELLIEYIRQYDFFLVISTILNNSL